MIAADTGTALLSTYSSSAFGTETINPPYTTVPVIATTPSSIVVPSINAAFSTTTSLLFFPQTEKTKKNKPFSFMKTSFIA